MILKVYVVTHEPYHDNGTVMGAYSSVENAMNAYPCDWFSEGHYVTHQGAVREASDPPDSGSDYLIWELEIDKCG
jgi:hypothetical protein